MKHFVLLGIFFALSSIAYGVAPDNSYIKEEEAESRESFPRCTRFFPVVYLVVVGLAMIMQDHVDWNEMYMRDF